MSAKQPEVVQVDLDSVLADVQKLYSKDKKSMEMLQKGDTIRRDFTAADGIPIDEDHPIFELINLPCIPFNKIYQFSGLEDTGKSTFGGLTIAAAQKAGFQVILWDTEDKFDAGRLKDYFGGDPDRILLVKTNEILQGAEKVRKLVIALKSKYPDLKLLIVWDSVGGSQSRSHAERELDNEKSAQPGQDAKENASVMKTFTALFNKYPDSICVYLANQVYAKIGFMQHGEKESGGNKIAFHSSVIVRLKRIKKLVKTVKGVKKKFGIITRATVTKNHISRGELSTDSLDFQITAHGAKLIEGGSDSDSGEE